MPNLNTYNFVEAGVAGVVAASVDQLAPGLLNDSGKNMRRAAKTGIFAASANLISSAVDFPSMLPQAAGSVPMVSKKAVSDGILFAGLQMTSKSQRTTRGALYNLLMGVAISSVSSTVITPMVVPYLGGMNANPPIFNSSGPGVVMAAGTSGSMTSSPNFA